MHAGDQYGKARIRDRGMAFAAWADMRPIEPTRWDDLVLAALLLIIGAPFAVYALLYERPVDAQGALSMGCVVLALLILIRRNTWAHPRRRNRMS